MSRTTLRQQFRQDVRDLIEARMKRQRYGYGPPIRDVIAVVNQIMDERRATTWRYILTDCGKK